MSRFFSGKFKDLEAYTPGEQPKDQKYIKLNTNESPFPPSPRVINAVSSEQVQLLNLYPDPTVFSLASAIADSCDLLPCNVAVGNGSDEILAFIFNAFCDSEKGIVFPDVTYGFYPVFAKMFGVKYSTVPLDSQLRINVDDYRDINDNVIIANPNAQTGIYLELSEIEKLVLQNPDRVVIIDEAYIDFGGESAAALIPKYDNLIVVRTFSKSRNLAGARLGFSLSCKELANDINTMKYSFNPYSINRLSLICGIEAMRDTGYMESCMERIIENRGFLTEKLEALGFQVLPSKANFVLARSNKISGKKLYEELKKRGILVRYLGDKRIADYVRITVGTKEQMIALIFATVKILESANDGIE